jgi:hypothetical protein
MEFAGARSLFVEISIKIPPHTWSGAQKQGVETICGRSTFLFVSPRFYFAHHVSFNLAFPTIHVAQLEGFEPMKIVLTLMQQW